MRKGNLIKMAAPAILSAAMNGFRITGYGCGFYI